MAVKCSLKLFAQLTKDRRCKVLTGIHKDLAHRAEEQFKATSALFGEDKTLRSIKQPFQKDGAQRTNQFGCHENQGYTQQSWFKPWTSKKVIPRKISQITTSQNVDSEK